ncbi:sugar nucleotide-binding protein [Adlercreutzia sp. ZJ242]|uniref:sugar nucleotide-binding protein n=1 Tax=Adlercreutzia sp. ZJ242 TaxID=2709409 RepID=UPI0013E9A035|nr:sugar nucleotide-binding protein [Adlercreutzia sp. ZJ242]
MLDSSESIFVIGSTGYIGSRVAGMFEAAGRAVTGMSVDDPVHPVDLAADEPLASCPFGEGDLVVFAAAVSGPDQCANDREACWRVNVEGTSKVVGQAIGAGARVLFFSSDAVFPPDEGVAYDEESARGPAFAYGEMKAEVERRFEGSPLFKALRLSYVASDHDRFVGYLRGCAARGEEAEVFHPFYRSATTLSDVLASVSWLAGNWGAYPHAYLHVCGPELVSRVRMADEVLRMRAFPGLRYRIAAPPEGFFDHRPEVAQIKSIYAADYRVYDAGESFTSKFQREMKGIER